MAPTNFPEEGAQARRKADGLIGDVYAADPNKDLLTVRWSARPGLNTLVCTSEQFARDWELTGNKSSSPKELIKSFVAVAVFMAVCCFLLVKSCDSNPASSGSSSAATDKGPSTAGHSGSDSKSPNTANLDEEVKSAQRENPVIVRGVYAMQVEDDMRKSGSDVSVEATGGIYDTLKITAKAVLTDSDAESVMNAVFSNNSLIGNLKSYGFKEVVITSGPSKETWRGYDTWTRKIPSE
jgi:hypothetical protein